MAKRSAPWKRVKFGEVVRQIKEKADPETSGLARFVAGEHMDTNDLRIRRWGDIGDGYLGPAFHARFRPGQVLYGSRRTYLRKVAVADFDGICANTTFVLESRDPEVLLPELLPFIMQTEAFHEHSKRESKGSVNPYVNFSDLAWYEFALPPVDEQRRAVAALDATILLEECIKSARIALASSRAALGARHFGARGSTDVCECASLIAEGAIALQTGPFGTVLKASAYRPEGHPLINPVDMDDGHLSTATCARIGADDWRRLEKYWMKAGDMLLGRKRHMRNLVFVEPQHEGYVVGSDCIRFRADPSRVAPRYLFHLLRSDAVQHWLQAQAGGNGTVMPGMNEKILGKLRLRIPSLNAQVTIAGEFDELEKTLSGLTARLGEGRNIRRMLLLQLNRHSTT